MQRRKRAVDIVLGSVLALLALPLMTVLALLSAASLRTWPLFTQDRPGRDETPFRIIKIRTLPRSVPAYGHKSDLQQELRTSPAVCRFLRRTHLDELPQLLLVPIGRMSLVGPRPSQPLAFEHLGQGFEHLRTDGVRPGCTGLWQIGAAHDLSLDADHGYDLFYLAHCGARLDTWILVRTVLFMAGLARPITVERIPRWAAGSPPS